jgi:hypothetical protein
MAYLFFWMFQKDTWENKAVAKESHKDCRKF